jgi:hypothetical protein
MTHTATFNREISVDYDYTPGSPGSYLVPPESPTVYIRAVYMDGEEIKLPISEIRDITRQILESPPENSHK